MDDLCRECGHSWHGLVCNYVTQSYREWGGTVHIPCKCPSQFKE